jgi:hypothetical protein
MQSNKTASLSRTFDRYICRLPSCLNALRACEDALHPGPGKQRQPRQDECGENRAGGENNVFRCSGYVPDPSLACFTMGLISGKLSTKSGKQCLSIEPPIDTPLHLRHTCHCSGILQKDRDA